MSVRWLLEIIRVAIVCHPFKGRWLIRISRVDDHIITFELSDGTAYSVDIKRTK